MSVAVSGMPLAPGDINYRIRTPAVIPPADPFASPFSPSSESTPDADTATGLTARRPSAGAVLAEAVGIDLNAIGKAEARKIMSVEHKVLGFRPPHGSLAAEAQAAAAKHPQVTGVQPPDPEKLKEAAKIDATRILAERKAAGVSDSGNSSPIEQSTVPLDDAVVSAVDLSTISEADARKLMSLEHRALGFRPPPGSLAAEAQAATAKQPTGAKDAARRNSIEHSGKPTISAPAKPRRGSNDTAGTKSGRGSNDLNGSKGRRGSNETNSDGKHRRGSNEGKGKQRRGSSDMTRTNSDSTNGVKPKGSGVVDRRASISLAGLPPAAKEELLKEVAFKDAERIKATRGINGEVVSAAAHVDVRELPADSKASKTTTDNSIETKPASPTAINSPAPVQPMVDSQTQRVEVEPGVDRVTVPAPVEPDDEEAEEAPHISRSETTDSVQIVGDVLN